jgi:hypothetical protein
MGLYDTNVSSSGWNFQSYCQQCKVYYFGTHTCANYMYYPTTYNTGYWCATCNVWVQYPSTVAHICLPKQLESKPKYGEHNLECGCKVKTVVVEYCTDLHKDPDESESS